MTTEIAASAAHEMASEADRQWFLDHGARQFRVRLPFPGEVRPVFGRTQLVLVIRAHAKARMRLPFYVDAPPPPSEEIPEEMAIYFYKRITASDPRVPHWLASLRASATAAGVPVLEPRE